MARLLRRLFVLLLVAPAALAQAPSSLSYQGYLESGGQPVDNPSATLTFRLFSAPTGGSELWAETKAGVAVEGGLFTTDLGSVTPLGGELFFGPLYLSVAVGGAGAPQLAPRTALRAAPYARTLVAPAQIFGEDEGTLLTVQNLASGATGTGLYAETSATEGRAVFGLAGASGGENAGVFGQSESTDGYGVYGTGPNAGVRGASLNVGVYGSGNLAVLGLGINTGVSGSGSEYGVRGASANVGVRGEGEFYGVYGTSPSYGVYGESSNVGVFGRSISEDAAFHYGVYGISNFTGRAVYGENTSILGYAGYFQGKVSVSGTLTKGGGAFQIDHPLDPAGRILRHSFVESPDMMNVYNGNATLDAQGEAVVELPAYFEALNRDFRYQLTALGAPGPNLYVAEKVVGNRFRIAGGAPGMEVSWQVTGIRQDAWAEENRIVVEEDKPADERGRYLHPSAFGLPREQGVDFDAEREARMAEMEQARLALEDAPSPLALPAPVPPPPPPARRDR